MIAALSPFVRWIAWQWDTLLWFDSYGKYGLIVKSWGKTWYALLINLFLLSSATVAQTGKCLNEFYYLNFHILPLELSRASYLHKSLSFLWWFYMKTKKILLTFCLSICCRSVMSQGRRQKSEVVYKNSVIVSSNLTS